MKIKLFLLINLTLFFAASAAEMEGGSNEFQFSATDHLLFSNTKDPIDDNAPFSHTVMHEAYLFGEYGPYRGHVQFTNRLTPDSPEEETRVFVLEKKLVGADWEQVELRLGDTHQEFGRGIALSLFRDDAFGLNTTLEGAAFTYRPSFGQFSVVGGRLNSLESAVAINALEDPLNGRTFWVVGAEGSMNLGNKSQLDVHYVLGLNEPNDKTGMGFGKWDKTYNIGGVGFSKEGLFEDVDLYVESNFLLMQRLRKGKYSLQPTGWGNYSSLVWTPMPWLVKWEIKDYRRFGFEWRRPPTLELDIIETDNEEDITASRIYVDHTNITTRTKFYGSYLAGKDFKEDAMLNHAIGGGKFKWFAKSKWEVQAGYRAISGKKNLVHGSVKMKFPTFKKQAVELTYRKEIWNKSLDFMPTEEDRNVFDFTYTFPNNWMGGIGYEYIPSNDELVGNHFVNVNASVRSGPVIAKGFIGQTSGGTLCSGGVCRKVPPYTGGYIETIYSF